MGRCVCEGRGVGVGVGVGVGGVFFVAPLSPVLLQAECGC